MTTLTQLWGHREVRQMQELQDRIMALPDDSQVDKQVLLALPIELQRELLEEQGKKLASKYSSIFRSHPHHHFLQNNRFGPSGQGSVAWDQF